MENRKTGYYWVKWNKISESEVAKWDKDTWRFTDGSKSKTDPFEVDERPITHQPLADTGSGEGEELNLHPYWRERLGRDRQAKVISESLVEMVELWSRIAVALPILKGESAYRKAKNIVNIIQNNPESFTASHPNNELLEKAMMFLKEVYDCDGFKSAIDYLDVEILISQYEHR